MQIRTLVIYNAQGQKRTINFNLNSVNIITGQSKTGKSSLINIIDYCLGRSTFQVAAGIITENVVWYGLLCQFTDFQVFIAKPKPDFGKTTQSGVYFEIATDVAIPEMSDLILNFNDETLIYELSRLIGITPNLNIPAEGQTRDALEATIDHAKLLNFQQQGVISNPEVLFHRQAEPFMPQAIKDTIPYFLGVIQEDRLRLLHELQDKRRKLRGLRRDLSEADLVIEQRANKGKSLIVEAQQVGLISSEINPESVEDFTEVLSGIRLWEPTLIPPLGDDRLYLQEQELVQLRENYQEKQNAIYAIEAHVKYANAYLGELSEHALRLESINLFDDTGNDEKVCPLCGTTHQLAPVSFESISRSLQNLHIEVGFVTREQPELDAYTRTLKQELEEIRTRIQQKEFDLTTLIEEQNAAAQYRDTNTRIARVVGRVSYYLDLTPQTLDDEAAEIKINISRLEREIAALELQLDNSNLEDRKASILNIIGTEMTRLARLLELEHQVPYRLDLNRLTVVADRPSGPIIMNQNMGSAANHLGSHLIALLALHKYFIQQNRPVPSFLVLDQPTQVYFPPELTGESQIDGRGITDEDRTAVNRMFQVFFEVAQETGLQVIILEHANLDTPDFQAAIVDHVWRGGYALIPEHWLSSTDEQ